MNKINFKTVQAELRSLGLTIRKAYGEYRVNYQGGSEATAYYTTDLEDAHATGLHFTRSRTDARL